MGEITLWVRSRADAAKAKKPPVLWSFRFRSPRAELAPNCCCCGCDRLRLGEGEEVEAGDEADSATGSRGECGEIGDAAGVESKELLLMM